MTIEELETKIAGNVPKSAWSRGVKSYALEMLEKIEDTDAQADTITLGDLINHVGYKFIKIGCFTGALGACSEMSWGGKFEIYSEDIAQRLATPSEIKKCTHKNGSFRNEFGKIHWLDIQARAIYQAVMLIQRNAKE